MDYRGELDEKTDEDLVRLTLADQKIFACLVNRYRQKLSWYIKKISGLGHEDAEDLLQDIFIGVYKNLNHFDRRLKFSSWIYRIAHNKVISDFRRRKSAPRQISWDNAEILEKLTAEFKIEEATDRGLASRRLGQAMEKLDYRYREVLTLRFWEEKSYEEISDILQKPAGTVATLINRAKTRLKNEIKKQTPRS